MSVDRKDCDRDGHLGVKRGRTITMVVGDRPCILQSIVAKAVDHVWWSPRVCFKS